MYSISDLKRSMVQIKLKMTTESNGPRTKLLPVYVGAGDSPNQPKIKYEDNNYKAGTTVGRLSLYTSLGVYQAGAYLGLRSMKRIGVLLLPTGWDASPSQDYPQQ